MSVVSPRQRWSRSLDAATTLIAAHQRSIAAVLLLVCFVFRLQAGFDYWSAFDRQFPGLWDASKVTLSQDVNKYVGQAAPDSWIANPDWTSRPFARPPVASFYYQALFQLFGFERSAVVAVQAVVATIGHAFVYGLVCALLGPVIALLALALSALHPVLIFHDASFEDSTLGFALFAAALYSFDRHRREGATPDLAFAGILFAMAILARLNILAAAAFAIAYGVLRWTRSGPEIPAPAATIAGRATGLTGCSLHAVVYALPALLAAVATLAHHARSGAEHGPISIFGSNAAWAVPIGLAGIAFAAYFVREAARSGRTSAIAQGGFSAALAILSCFSMVVPALLIGIAYCVFRVRRGRVERPAARRPVHPLWVLLPMIVVLAPASLHNWLTAGKLSPFAATLPINLYLGNVSQSYYRTALDGPIGVPLLNTVSPWNFLARAHREELDRHAGSPLRLLAARFADEPLQFAQRLLVKSLTHFSSIEIPRNTDFEHLRGTSPLFGLPLLPYAVVAGFAIAFLLRGRPRARGAALLLLVPLAACWTTDTLVFGASRYRALAIPFLVPLALAGAAEWLRNALAGRWLRAAAGFGIVALLVVVGVSFPADRERRSHVASQWYKDARMQLYAGNPYMRPDALLLGNARAFQADLRRALEIDPDHLPAWYLDSMHRLLSGQSSEAASLAAAQERKRRCAIDDWLCRRVSDAVRDVAMHRREYLEFIRHTYSPRR